MKNTNNLLLLGNPKLYQTSAAVKESERQLVNGWVGDLHRVVEEIRDKYSFGRAIAAPQLGIMKRLIYVNIEKPKVFINPKFTYMSDETFELWDDCMSFPALLVKVKRHKTVTIKYLNSDWQSCEETFTDDLAELIQHEYDHLDGILSTMRAIDSQSFRWAS